MCPDCEEFRFPSKQPNRKCNKSGSLATDIRKSANTSGHAGEKPKTGTKTGTKTRSQKTANAKSSDTECEHENDRCVSCLSTFRNDDGKVSCTVCDGLLHFACTGVQEKMRKPFFEIVEHTGWVCEDCRRTARSAVQKMKAEVANLAESIAKLQAEVVELQTLRQPQPEASVVLATFNEPPRPAQSTATSSHVH